MHGQEETRLRRRRLKRAAVSGLLGFSLIAPGLAFGQSWYAGVGAGQSSMRDETEALLGTSFDDTDTGWKVFGGYLFLPTVTFEPNAGIELGYVDFGRFTGTAPGVSDNWEATGINLSLVGVLPLEYQFSLLAKIGATRWDVDNRFTSPLGSGSPSETGTDFSFGVGAQYDFTEQVGTRLEWERFRKVGDENITGQSDLDLLSLSVLFQF